MATSNTAPPKASVNRLSTTWSMAVLGLIFILVTLATKPESYGDTPVYSGDILAYISGTTAASQDRLWEFGHVLWRPLGYLALKIGNPVLTYYFPDSPFLKGYAALIAINLLSGTISFFLVYLIALRFSQNILASFIAALTFLFTNAHLNYYQSGTSYVPGAMCQLVSVFLLARAADRGRFNAGVAIAAGAALGASVCLWFPYVLSIPGLLLFGWLWGRPFEWRDTRTGASRIRFLLIVALGAAAVIVAIYGIAIIGRHIENVQDFKIWFANSSHEIKQTKGYLRIATGLPRTFLNLGDDTIAFKRFLFKDPYVKVSLLDLASASIWKMLLVYIFLSAFAISLWRSDKGKVLLASFLASALPVLVFAMFLFEPSSMERYMPFYALLFPSLALAFVSASKLLRWPFVIFTIATAMVNVSAMSGAGTAHRYASAIARIEALKPELRPNSRAIAVTFRDRVLRFKMQLPFHPVNRHGAYPIEFLMEPGSGAVATWGAALNRWALLTWGNNGDLWISRRFLADRPEAEWDWVEGDDARISWKDLPRFFQTLQYGRSVGGPDGFVEIPPSPENRQRIAQLAAAQTAALTPHR